MGMICIIAEKPSVVAELARIVGAGKRETGYIEGNGYIVTWAIGHLVTLAMPQQYGIDGFRKEDLPLVPNPFKLVVRQIKKDGEYVNDPAAVRQLSVIRQCFNRSEKIIVATDAGREGELIFRYIHSYLNCDKPFQRLWISSLTDKAIRDGFGKLRHGGEFDSLYEAGRSRSDADWLVGINASRALSISAGRNGFSLGRVQTPTLSIICKRYLENKAFTSVPFWRIEAIAEKGNVQWKAVSEQTFAQREAALSVADAILSENKSADGNGLLSVSKVERKEVRDEPPLLYDLTSLQKDANKKYGLSADATLSLAQSLYEKKLATYPRTGSRYIGEDVFEEIPDLLVFCRTLLGLESTVSSMPDNGLNSHSVDASKVTDHHALLVTGNVPGQLSDNEKKIYRMVATRMLEAFSEASLKIRVTAILTGAGVDFNVKAEKLSVPEWRSILNEEQENAGEYSSTLPDFKEGDKLEVCKVDVTEHKTKPKPLFSESTLLSASENAGRDIEDGAVRKAIDGCGIGTPATRAGIIETLLLRDYIRREKKTLVPTDKGLAVYQIVKDKQIANAEMTGQWEMALAGIENGDRDARSFNEAIKNYTGQICREILGTSVIQREDSELFVCPVCGKKSVRIYPKVAKCTQEECDFKVFRNVCGKTLSDAEVRRLLTDGRTPTLKGLTGKSGKKIQCQSGVEA